jgi:hypothetical protein
VPLKAGWRRAKPALLTRYKYTRMENVPRREYRDRRSIGRCKVPAWSWLS